jgi:endonuclease/exonuclease/phosphatase family metal-dependent hydrolase
VQFIILIAEFQIYAYYKLLGLHCFYLNDQHLTQSRNVLKVVVDVPTIGELHFHCTHLDHLNEEWRMKQVMAMMSRDDAPHVLAGSLNSLDTTDYLQERWEDIDEPQVNDVKF